MAGSIDCIMSFSRWLKLMASRIDIAVLWTAWTGEGVTGVTSCVVAFNLQAPEGVPAARFRP